MKRKAQPMLSQNGQYTLDQYIQILQQFEDLSPVTIRNYASDLCQFIAWCEHAWREMQEGRTFTPQAVAPALLVRYRDHLQNTLGLKPTTVNRTLMSLKRYFAWARKAQLIQSDPASLIKFVPKEASSPRHLSIDLPRLWGMIRWIRRCFIFVEQDKISSRMWRKSHGYSKR